MILNDVTSWLCSSAIYQLQANTADLEQWLWQIADTKIRTDLSLKSWVPVHPRYSTYDFSGTTVSGAISSTWWREELLLHPSCMLLRRGGGLRARGPPAPGTAGGQIEAYGLPANGFSERRDSCCGGWQKPIQVNFTMSFSRPTAFYSRITPVFAIPPC